MNYTTGFLDEVAVELKIDTALLEQAVRTVAARRNARVRTVAVGPSAELQHDIEQAIASTKAEIGRGFRIADTGMGRRFETERLTDEPAIATFQPGSALSNGRELADQDI